jgi:hypothetical protein
LKGVLIKSKILKELEHKMKSNNSYVKMKR